MRIHVINPNSTVSMTAQIGRAAQRAASTGTEIDLVTATGTPVSIEGYADEALAVPAMLAAIRTAEARGAKAHVIACFDDPGLSAAREVAAAPVIGICQAAVQVAVTLAARFSVITTLQRSVPIIEDLVESYGAGRRCRRVRAIDLPVLALDENPEDSYALLVAEIRAARDQDGAEAIVLGCAGMAEMCERLTEETGVPVIDGVTAAVRNAEALIGMGYRTSKLGGYAWPRAKTGGFAPEAA
ncbi:aspartate/glutamate racemase family protein [Pseudorhodobacter turbinis]|uniref:Hydantoin racemase n=2 Tax=Pseudorhodobacter turbinis TaxID=2500533 RepID=A0A4P8EHQ0_9RHOB|nr:aspartate/glutamate racemase family protein [Pseudorhodobacter turbinis]QCO56458.1 aspartate/glutamate racemase family protein [Pseudorhodobacter turbinis]